MCSLLCVVFISRFFRSSSSSGCAQAAVSLRENRQLDDIRCGPSDQSGLYAESALITTPSHALARSKYPYDGNVPFLASPLLCGRRRRSSRGVLSPSPQRSLHPHGAP